MNKPDLSDAMAQLLISTLLRDEDPQGLHKHKCKSCGYVWQHENSCVNHIPAHTCICGKRQWSVYEGSDNGERKLWATIPRPKMTPEEWQTFCESEDKLEAMERN